MDNVRSVNLKKNAMKKTTTIILFLVFLFPISYGQNGFDELAKTPPMDGTVGILSGSKSMKIW